MSDIDTRFWVKKDIKCTSNLVLLSQICDYCDESDIFITIQNNESRSRDLFENLMKNTKKIFNHIILISSSNKNDNNSIYETTITKIEDKSNDYVISEILKYIHDEKKIQSKPIKLCVDISSLNPYVISGILIGCFDKLLVSKYTLFYSPGKNYKKNIINSEILDKSRLKDISSSEHKDYTLYFASPGYHLKWCMECIRLADPDFVEFFATSPGFTEESDKEVKKDIEWLSRIHPNYKTCETEKGDLCDTLFKIDNELEIHNEKSNFRCLLFGPKSHVVAFTILYLLNQKITLTYGFPEVESDFDIKSTGDVNVYEIFDLKLAGYLFGN